RRLTADSRWEDTGRQVLHTLQSDCTKARRRPPDWTVGLRSPLCFRLSAFVPSAAGWTPMRRSPGPCCASVGLHPSHRSVARETRYRDLWSTEYRRTDALPHRATQPSPEYSRPTVVS